MPRRRELDSFASEHLRGERAESVSRALVRRLFPSVAVQQESRFEIAVSESYVTFVNLEPERIAAYVLSGEPFDKAGAYAIQGRAARFVVELRGSYSGVMGLPLYETGELLDKLQAARRV